LDLIGYRDATLKLFTGTANRPLAEAIAAHLGIRVGEAEAGRFSNGEIQVIIRENVRGTDAFVVQPLCAQVNESLMELLVMIDALRRASARRITAVVPYFAYARQDRKARGREPISAKLVANLVTTAGAGRVLTMDLHAPQIQGFFDIPLDHLTGTFILGEYFAGKHLENPMVFSPDAGGVARARVLAEWLGVPLGFIDKRRPEPGVAEVMNIIGKVQGRRVIMMDDMIDTAGTVTRGAEALLAAGAVEVYACCSHAVLSGPGVARLLASSVREVVVTDTIPLSQAATQSGRFTVLSVAPLLGEAIIRIHEDLSVSRLFEGPAV
jgi:ribose-phosphate pyrophosphokinase